MNSHVTNHSCTLAYSRFHPSSSRRSYRRRHIRVFERKIRKIEYQLKLNCEETTVQQSRVSLKQLQRRVERIEHHLKKQNQQAKVKLSTKHCLKFLLPEAKHWHNIGIMLGVSETTLEQIEADYHGDCQQCVREMIKSWLKQIDPPPSWKDLAESVREFNPSLAKKIVDYAATACRATDFKSLSSMFVQPL